MYPTRTTGVSFLSFLKMIFMKPLASLLKTRASASLPTPDRDPGLLGLAGEARIPAALSGLLASSDGLDERGRFIIGNTVNANYIEHSLHGGKTTDSLPACVGFL